MQFQQQQRSRSRCSGPSQPLAAKGAESSTLASAVTPFPYEPSHSLQSQQQQRYGLGFAQSQGPGAYGAPSPSPTPGAAPGYAGQPGSAALARNTTGPSTHPNSSSNAGSGAGTGAAYGHRPGLSACGGSFRASNALGVDSVMSGNGRGHAKGAGASLNGRLTPGGGSMSGSGSGGASGSSNGAGARNNDKGHLSSLPRNTTLRKIRGTGGRVSPYPPPPPASLLGKLATAFAGGPTRSSGLSEATSAVGFTPASTAATAGAGTALGRRGGDGKSANLAGLLAHRPRRRARHRLAAPGRQQLLAGHAPLARPHALRQQQQPPVRRRDAAEHRWQRQCGGMARRSAELG